MFYEPWTRETDTSLVQQMATDASDIVRVLEEDSTDRTAGLSPAAVTDLYRTQVLARTFDEKAVSLHGQGRIGTYAPLLGQEAAQVGAISAITPRDYCFPTYRDHAMYLSRGFSPTDILLHLLGRGNMVDTNPEGTRNTFPPTIPIATQ